jgi:peptidoglycan/xylan/chitin deacetylase (PgdA/CDA1 family)
MAILTLSLIVVSLSFISVIITLYRPPQSLIAHLQRRYPDAFFHQPTQTRKILALTIDDGPSEYTHAINRILTAHGARATFFIIGSNIPGRQDVLRTLLESGHELGNHAMRDEPSVKLSAEELRQQITAVERHLGHIYASANGTASRKQPKFFRPGSGFFNRSIRHIVKTLGYQIVLGSVYPWDAQIFWPRLNAWHILSSVRPGSVVVVHERQSTLEMLSIVLPKLTRMGWQVVTVSELLEQTRADTWNTDGPG